MSDVMASPADFGARAAFDYRGLERLRQGVSGPQSRDADVREVAQQFEALFLHMMLKRMREATPRDGLFDSDQTRMVQSLADEQMATQLADPGIGLAQALLDQIQGQRQGPQVEPPPPAPSPTPLPQAAEGTPVQSFVSRMAGAASRVAARIGLPAPLVLAQAALESGWGAREIRHPDGRPSHNLFGIKAGRDWQGDTVKVMTTEYENGVARKVAQPFRAYRSYAESFDDYARLLANNPRYEPVLRARSAPEAARQLQAAGYATDPAYADKLIKLIKHMSALPDSGMGSDAEPPKFIASSR